jgi:hypothetical protein
VAEMLETDERPAKPGPKNAHVEKLRRMNANGDTSK